MQRRLIEYVHASKVHRRLERLCTQQVRQVDKLEALLLATLVFLAHDFLEEFDDAVNLASVELLLEHILTRLGEEIRGA